MMPIGTSIMPARTLKPRDSRKSTYACSSSSSPGFLEALDERVLELELADEADAGREAVVEEQHEAVEVEHAGLPLELVEVEVHVARQRARSRLRLRRRLGRRLREGGGGQ